MSQTVREIAERHIYVASRASVPARPEMWKRMRAVGWPIISSWIDEAGPGETASMRELWAKIHAEISACSLLVMYAEPSDLPLKGAYVEAGIALALGKPVIVVSTCDVGSWANHPQVKVVREMPSLPEALEACDRYLAAHVLASTETLGNDLAARNLILRKHIHAIECHNQYFERCESAWCNPNPPLAAAGGFNYDPASMPHGDPFVFKQDALIADLRAQLQAAQQEREELRELACQDADIAGYYGDDPESANQCFVQKIRELLDAQWKLLRTLNCGSLDAIQSAAETLRQLADERGREVERLRAALEKIRDDYGQWSQFHKIRVLSLIIEITSAALATPAATPPEAGYCSHGVPPDAPCVVCVPTGSNMARIATPPAEFHITPEEAIEYAKDEEIGEIPRPNIPPAQEHPDMVCTICHQPAKFQKQERVWRHKPTDPGDIGLHAQTFCDKYGYPIEVTAATPPAHAYTSTACQHGLHERCRKACKFCGVDCACSCHATEATPPAQEHSDTARLEWLFGQGEGPDTKLISQILMDTNGVDEARQLIDMYAARTAPEAQR